MKPVLLVASSLLTLSFTTSALAMNSRILCTYPSHSGSLETLTLDGPEGVDLAEPFLQTVPLKINGAEVATIFDVKTSLLHVGYMVTYSDRDPVFANSLSITYELDYNKGGTFTGTWMTDVPPVLKLNCSFADPDLK